MEEGIRTKGLMIGHSRPKGAPHVLTTPLELQAGKGELVALVGPNGCGKSTLLRTMAGLHAPLEGSVLIEGHPLEELSPRQKARLLSIVLTTTSTPGNMKVEELVTLGRTPYRSGLSPYTEEDRRIVYEAMEHCKVEGFAQRPLDTLSDGETQRTMIARALAQESSVMLLDEPTAHLDLLNRVEIVRMLRELARERGLAVVLSSHDLDLVLRLADRIWLMSGDAALYQGIPEELAMNGHLSEVFSNEHIRFDQRTGDFRPLERVRETLVIEGNGVRTFWTIRALERIGYELRTKSSEFEEAHVVVDEKGYHFKGRSFPSLEKLVRSLE